MENMIKGYPKGSDLTIMNTIHRHIKDDKGKSKELLQIVYRDNTTGKKYVEEIINPSYTYYIAKEDCRVPYNRLFIPKEEAEPVTVPYKKLESDIAGKLNMTQWFYNNLSTGNARENQKLHTHPDIFMSDMNIEDWYRFRFDQEYKNEPFAPTKAFFDIEVDTKHMTGDFPEPGECPVNAVSLLMPYANKLYIFLLKTKGNNLIDEFINSIKDKSVFSNLKNFLITAIGGEEKLKKMGLNNLDIQFLFYEEEDEIKLIADLFSAINSYEPDFVLAWNIAFDLPYLIARIQRLGYSVENIISHPDFKYKYIDYRIDERNLNEAAERCDYGRISSYSVYLDQLIQFASRRKGQTKFTSYSLDYIGETVAKVKKLDYKNITTSLALLPEKNYKVFVFYNIMDTMVQACIEASTGDIDYIFAKCLDNNVRYSKGHRQTVFLYGKAAKEWFNAGFIIGNNVNRYNEKPKTKFPGAFVADPVKTGTKSKVKIGGTPVFLYDTLVDFDYASLYPSVLREFNIAQNTQIGQIQIPDAINHKAENRFNDPKWTRDSQFIEDLQSHEWLEIATRWFGLPNYFELYKFVENMYTHEVSPNYGLRLYDNNGMIDPMAYEDMSKLIQPMVFERDDSYIEMTKYNVFASQQTQKEIKDHASNNQQF